MANTLSDNTIITKYLMELLSPEQKEELDQLLGNNKKVSANPDDLAEDALQGRIAMDRLPPRIKRQAMARVAPDHSAATAGFDKMFPDAGRLR